MPPDQFNFKAPAPSSEANTFLNHPTPHLLHYAGDLATKAVILAQMQVDRVASAAAELLDAAQHAIRLDTAYALTRVAMVGFLSVALLGNLKEPKEAQAAAATAGLTTVVTAAAAGGIFSRRTPHLGDTPQIIGQGYYPGDTVTIWCGITDGDPDGPHNPTWYFTHNSSRSQPDSWVNAHYVDTPEGPGQLAPGVSTCVNESEHPMSSTPPQPSSGFHPVEQPWSIPTISEHTYIDRVVWMNTPDGESLHVYVTKRGYTEARVTPRSAFAEALRDAHLPYSDSMYNQFVCHAYLAPPTKVSWNLDTWRPDVGLPQTMMKDNCNPQPGEKKLSISQSAWTGFLQAVLETRRGIESR